MLTLDVIATSFELVAIGAGVVALGSAIGSLLQKLLTQRRVYRDAGHTRTTVTVRVGHDTIKLDLEDPEEAAEFLAALDASRTSEDALGRILKYRAESTEADSESQ